MADDTAVQVPQAGVQVQANPSVGSYIAPQTNAALSLAGALAEAHPKVDGFLGALGAQLKAGDEAKASAAAMKSNAPGLADAVRRGEIPAGSSEWFVQAFNQDRAQIASQQQTADIVAQSQSWAERGYQDGGVSYNQRLQAELGKVREGLSNVPGMHPIDAQAGFDKGAAPLGEQAIQANNRYQLQSIATQKIQDSTTLLEQGIQQATQNNPLAKPSEILASLEPQFKQMEAIGFSKADVQKMAFNSILGAGYNAMDGDLIHGLATAPFRGGTALSLIAGEDGKPYGEQIGYADYRIEQMQRAASLSETRAHTAQIQAEGNKASDLVMQHFGWDLVSGKTTPTEVTSFLQQQGVSVPGALEGMRQLDKQVEGLTGFSKSMIAANEANPDNTKQFLAVAEKVATQGLRSQDIDQINQMVAMGQITREKGMQLVSTGQARSNVLLSEGRADARSQKDLEETSKRDARQAVQDAWTNGNRNREDNNGDAVNGLVAAGYNGVIKDAAIKSQLETVGNAAYRSYLAQHPAANGVVDWQGASTAQRAALAAWSKKKLDAMRKTKDSALKSGAGQ